jgi:hypothetical protein
MEILVKPGESIGEKVSLVPEGSLIKLTQGEWKENILIGKSLHLKGAGKNKTLIWGKADCLPVIKIFSQNEEIEVTIEDLRISGAKRWDGLQIQGQAKVNLINLEISENDLSGLVFNAKELTIKSSNILSNRGYGILAQDEGKLALFNSIVAKNRKDGIRIEGKVRAKIIHNQIQENGDFGLFASQESNLQECWGNEFSENSDGNVNWKAMRRCKIERF